MLDLFCLALRTRASFSRCNVCLHVCSMYVHGWLFDSRLEIANFDSKTTGNGQACEIQLPPKHPKHATRARDDHIPVQHTSTQTQHYSRTLVLSHKVFADE